LNLCVALFWFAYNIHNVWRKNISCCWSFIFDVQYKSLWSHLTYKVQESREIWSTNKEQSKRQRKYSFSYSIFVYVQFVSFWIGFSWICLDGHIYRFFMKHHLSFVLCSLFTMYLLKKKKLICCKNENQVINIFTTNIVIFESWKSCFISWLQIDTSIYQSRKWSLK